MRLSLFEFEDFHWFPTAWRNYGTDYLRFIATKFGIYKDLLPLIVNGVEKSRGHAWVDLASGGGSGLQSLFGTVLEKYPDASLWLTDKYPNEKAFASMASAFPGKSLHPVLDSVDACHLPARFSGQFCSIFGAFHHLSPAQAQSLFCSVVERKASLLIAEPVGRNFMSFFSMLFVWLNVLLFTPFLRPIRWAVLPFIYILPLVPLYVTWDGFASVMRTYSLARLRRFAAKADPEGLYEWNIGKTKGPMPVYFCFGTHK